MAKTSAKKGNAKKNGGRMNDLSPKGRARAVKGGGQLPNGMSTEEAQKALAYIRRIQEAHGSTSTSTSPSNTEAIAAYLKSL